MCLVNSRVSFLVSKILDKLQNDLLEILTWRWLVRKDQTPSLTVLPEARVSSRLPQILAISAFSFRPLSIVGNGWALVIPSINQIFNFLWIFHFLIMEGAFLF